GPRSGSLGAHVLKVASTSKNRGPTGPDAFGSFLVAVAVDLDHPRSAIALLCSERLALGGVGICALSRVPVASWVRVWSVLSPIGVPGVISLSIRWLLMSF